MPEAIAPVEKPAPTDAAKKAKRAVYQALEDYYDDSQKRYRPGHTDKSIADELGVSEVFVKGIRDADFGPISPPTEVSDFQTALNAMTSELAKLRGRFDSMVVKNGWRV